MGTPADVKDCPSCGRRLAAAAARCDGCKANLGTCQGCGSWLVLGTTCFDCGKTAAVPAPTAKKQKAAVPEEGIVFAGGTPAALVPVALVRLAASLLFVWLAALAVAHAVGGKPREWIKPVDWEGPSPVLLGVGAALAFILVNIAGTVLRAWRIGRTHLFGQPLRHRFSAGRLAWVLLSNLLILGVTAGLGLAWIHARNRKQFYARCEVPARGSRPLEFLGTGEEVLGRTLLTLLGAPLAVATAGLFAPVLTWMWVKWENSNLLFPDRFQQQQMLVFEGSFGAYYVRSLLGWILTILTAGLYRPWALASEWKWIAANTIADDTHRRTRPTAA